MNGFVFKAGCGYRCLSILPEIALAHIKKARNANKEKLEQIYSGPVIVKLDVRKNSEFIWLARRRLRGSEIYIPPHTFVNYRPNEPTLAYLGSRK